MSTQSAQKFIERVKVDDNFMAQLIQCETATKRMAFATTNGYDFSAEEIGNLKAQFSDDDLASTIYQESRLSYDSKLGHGLDPSPEPEPKTLL